MKNIHTLTCSNKKITLPILPNLEMTVEIEDNPFSLQLKDFFQMAARINKKRSFLFVSKLLGKHIPIKPRYGLLSGFMLASRYEEMVLHTNSEAKNSLLQAYYDSSASFNDEPFISMDKANPIIIGFAETATALGHSFSQAFYKGTFLHTTREVVNEISPLISFEEEHSHATSHRCYIKEEVLNNNREIILVDDELTTGKTAINIIRDIQSKYPRSKYTIVTILDWRSEASIKEMSVLEKELQINIQTVYLLKGKFTVSSNNINLVNEKEEVFLPAKGGNEEYLFLQNYVNIPSLPLTSTTQNSLENKEYYLKDTGRFGIEFDHSSSEWMESAANLLKEKRIGKTLCIGTGEFMYIPMRLAHFMGEDVWYQSTTRSPIFPFNKEHYGAKTSISFLNPEDNSIIHYLYNLKENQYDDIFLFLERKVEKKNLDELISKLMVYVKKVNIVFCSGRENIDECE